MASEGRRAIPALPFALCILHFALLFCPLSFAAAPPPRNRRNLPPPPAIAALEARLTELNKEGTGLALPRAATRPSSPTPPPSSKQHAADPASARAHSIIARCCEALGKHPEKEAAFGRYIDALFAIAKDQAAAELRAEIDIVARRELFAATKLLRLMLAKFPDGPEAAWALYRLGACYLLMDNFADAAAALRRGARPLAQRPGRRPGPPAHGPSQPRPAQARRHHRRTRDFLAEHPNAPQRDALLFDLATARYLAQDYYGALVAFQRLVREAPTIPLRAPRPSRASPSSGRHPQPPRPAPRAATARSRMAKHAILSDIHGNLEALLAVYRDFARVEGLHSIVSLGDLVGYGPNTAEVIAGLSSLAKKGYTVRYSMGNHDAAAIGRYEFVNFHDPVEAEFLATQAGLKDFGRSSGSMRTPSASTIPVSVNAKASALWTREHLAEPYRQFLAQQSKDYLALDAGVLVRARLAGDPLFHYVLDGSAHPEGAKSRRP